MENFRKVSTRKCKAIPRNRRIRRYCIVKYAGVDEVAYCLKGKLRQQL